MINTTAAFYGPVFLKALTYAPTVFKVDKVLVTVCGDQVITNADPTNPVFAITGNKPINSVWTSYSLAGIWRT